MPEIKVPKEPNWKCIWCELEVEGGSIHKCRK
jgi:hypothetical protein